MNKFEKINYEYFRKQYEDLCSEKLTKMIYDDIKLPTRGSKFSAGYDISIPTELVLGPHTTTKICTGIKCSMDDNLVLLVYIRSSMGIKKGLQLANTVGVIDKDYYSNPDNDGELILAITNTTDKEVYLEKGERVAQGIFTPYFLTVDDEVNAERTGGIGSTNK